MKGEGEKLGVNTRWAGGAGGGPCGSAESTHGQSDLAGDRKSLQEENGSV